MGDQHDRSLEDRMAAAERRLLAVESFLGISPPREVSRQPIAPPAPPPAAPAATGNLTPPPTPRSAPPTVPQSATPIPRAPRPVPPRPKREPISLETLVGGKVFAVVGALVIVTGIALFLKLAYDLGWLALISPAGKCLIGAGFGAALLIVGEFARRRWSPAASAALSATGIGALYASVYSAYDFYELLPVPAAFAMLAGVSVIGLFVAVRARLASVAVLSILSAYVTPILLSRSDSPPFVLPTYLLAIVGVGLGLSVIHARFRVLRSLVWWGTAILGTLWVFTEGLDAPAICVSFLTIAWLAFHAELWLASRRGAMGSGAPAIDVARPLLVSLGSTSWAVLLTALTLHEQGTPELWLAPGGAMILTSVLAMIMAGHLRVLTDVPRTDEERLGACLMAQSGALLIAAIAMGVTTDWLQIVAWLVFGLASVFAGRWIRSRALDAYGLIVLAIGLARLVLIDAWFGSMRTGGVETYGLVLTEWTLMMTIAGACWIAAGRLLLRENAGAVVRGLAIACSLVGVGAILVSIFSEDAAPASLALAWGVACVIALGAHAYERRLAFDAAGLAALVLAGFAWVAAYLVDGWDQTAGAWTIHPGLLVALTLVLVALVAARWLVKRATIPGTHLILAPAGVALLLVATSYEVARQVGLRIDETAAQTDALAAWWVLFGVGAVLWGAAKRLKPAQYVGAVLALVGVIAWHVSYPVVGWGTTSRAWTLHPGMWSAAFIVALLAGAAAWSRRRGTHSGALWMLGVAAVVLLFASTSLEVARHVVNFTDDAATRAGAVSIWWGLFAIALLLWGFLATRAPLRWTGLALLAVATAKAVILDLAGVDPAWRVASFLGLGLLMIGVGTWYLRAVARAAKLSSGDDDHALDPGDAVADAGV
ncbi:MAG: DUF2339 domain-containing protein [Phycisphaerales bacterium]